MSTKKPDFVKILFWALILISLALAYELKQTKAPIPAEYRVF